MATLKRKNADGTWEYIQLFGKDLTKSLITKQDTPPTDATVGDMWLDTSVDTYQGTVFADINSQLVDITLKVSSQVSVASYPLQTGETNDAARIQRAINAAAGTTLVIPPGTYNADGLILTDNTVVMGYGATIKGLSGSSAKVLTLSTGCRVFGLTIDGNKSVKTNGAGIYVPTNKTDYVIENCHIFNCVGQGVSLDIQANNGRVTKNWIHDCLHGVQWWGGDSQYSLWTANRGYVTGSNPDRVYVLDNGVYKYYSCTVSGTSSSTAPTHTSGTATDGTVTWQYDSQATIRGISNIYISGNIIQNVKGGIWGSLGDSISVVGNPKVENCSDVGIDLEGCSYSMVTGNNVKNCVNGCLTVFYGSIHVEFSGNTCLQQSGYSYGFKAYSKPWLTNTYISVINNDMFCYDHYAITCDSAVLGDSRFNNNIIRVQVTACAMRFTSASKLSIKHNKIYVATSDGIFIEGGKYCDVDDNYIETTFDNTTPAGSSGHAGIRLYWLSGTYSGQFNNVRNNVVKGFVTSIADDCWGDATSYNWIRSNRCDNIYVHAAANPANWKGLAEQNVSTTNPNTAITVTQY